MKRYFFAIIVVVIFMGFAIPVRSQPEPTKELWSKESQDAYYILQCIISSQLAYADQHYNSQGKPVYGNLREMIHEKYLYIDGFTTPKNYIDNISPGYAISKWDTGTASDKKPYFIIVLIPHDPTNPVLCATEYGKVFRWLWPIGPEGKPIEFSMNNVFRLRKNPHYYNFYFPTKEDFDKCGDQWGIISTDPANHQKEQDLPSWWGITGGLKWAEEKT